MIVIVGAGPAGMAAAVRARQCGKPVTVLDDNSTPGGQIWRGGQGSAWFAKFSRSGAQLLSGTRVFGGDLSRRTLRAETMTGAREISYDSLILATGARELFLPFPGWTLPGVMGAGGLQALVKSGLPVAGKRIVVAGSGPLLLAVAATMRKLGASVPLVAEQAAPLALLRFTAGLSPAKLLQGAVLATASFRPGSWVRRADGNGRLEQVELQDGKIVRCDYLAVAFGFVPNDELATCLGCDHTERESVYRAGESSDSGGLELSLVEGAIAGYSAAGRPDLAHKLFPKRAAALRFARRLKRTFTLREELRTLTEPDTVVCRCEDVPFGRLQTADSWRSAKLHFRCGMGPCQGRICGPAVQFLFNWRRESIRPPVFPARISSLISENLITSGEHLTK
jgi:NADPH-dependent 2,4-dienoyl-CoA reductase/sulfur reductase-like enzyme